jgi:hypothetical protein
MESNRLKQLLDILGEYLQECGWKKTRDAYYKRDVFMHPNSDIKIHVTYDKNGQPEGINIVGSTISEMTYKCQFCIHSDVCGISDLLNSGRRYLDMLSFACCRHREVAEK